MPQNSSAPTSRRAAPARLLVAGVVFVLIVIGAFVWIQRMSPASTTPTGVIADGAVVPAVAQPSTTGQALSLGQFAGKKVVVYFYEGAG